MIKRRLSRKCVLVVLDDVDDLKQLQSGSHDWFGEGSRIIITTRDEHLLTRHADTIYEVSLLSHKEVIELFNRHAYRKDKPVEDYEMLSQDVVSYAGGLPLALEILDSFLYDKDKDEWKSALAKLKCIPDVKVMERLKISYDGLEHNEKELFLDIACFMRRRWLIDEAMMVLDVYGFHPRIGIKVLVQKSLIKVSNGQFDMHDLVEEMARYIVRGEHPYNPEKHSRIWKEEDILEFCNMGAAAPLMETEVLSLPGLPPDVAFVDGELAYWISKSFVTHPRLPNIVANMKKLCWICWEGCPASSFPSNFQPTQLGCLMLIAGQQKQLWHGCKRLPNSKILELHDSKYLKRTPDFSGLLCLERLNLKQCEELKEIHQSIGYHERLVFVKIKGCSKVKMFPPVIRMKKLETLDLSKCYRLQKFPDIQSSMDSLVNLYLDRTAIEIIPHSVGEFCTNLVSFSLSRCHKLKRIDGNFHLLKHLKKIDLFGCRQLQKFARDLFDEECCLEELSLSINSQDSTSFKNLMYYIGLQYFHQDNLVSLKLPHFPRFLRKLNLSFCNLVDGDIPFDICELLNLQGLDLRGNQFSRLHSSLSRIPCLKCLYLSQCTSLVELPDLPSSIAILEAKHCDSLQSIGDLSYYKWLWKVSLWRRNKLIGGERVLLSMLQVNAVEDRFMSVQLPIGRPLEFKIYTTTLITLQLRHNWYIDFSGFLLCADLLQPFPFSIFINQEMLKDSQSDHWEEFDQSPGSYEYEQVGYVPFYSLRHTSWWNSAYTKISFEIDGRGGFKVELVPRKSKLGDSRVRATIDCSEVWEEDDNQNRKTFKIIEGSKSSNIEIVWYH